ncbi:hypothetical protein HOF65_08705 [bacterium]|nr:hypothetical protein [bacterium]MBT3853954.1 hypothetical protein [bacterium]MBT4632605.1 hypothetical protein [bacterium]MBT5491952.1 hypothetical protein [bacterium]MBT6779456.1 hypothetical protein [bacterium]
MIYHITIANNAHKNESLSFLDISFSHLFIETININPDMIAVIQVIQAHGQALSDN